MGHIAVSTASWDGLAERHLEGPAGDPATLEHYRAGEAAGEYCLLAVKENGRRCGSLLIRLEEIDGSERELVMVAGGGRGSRGTLANHVVPIVEHLAGQLGAGSIRYHTRNAAVARLMSRLGYPLAEYVGRRELSPAGRVH